MRITVEPRIDPVATIRSFITRLPVIPRWKSRLTATAPLQNIPVTRLEALRKIPRMIQLVIIPGPFALGLLRQNLIPQIYFRPDNSITDAAAPSS